MKRFTTPARRTNIPAKTARTELPRIVRAEPARPVVGRQVGSLSRAMGELPVSPAGGQVSKKRAFRKKPRKAA